jgi:hypothetical protein
MKQTAIGRARGVQLCSVADDEMSGITIAGETFVPDAATAYMEFFLSHAFPVYLDVPNPGELPDRTTIHPATVANSYRSLRGKVLNLAHLMRSYDPSRNLRDRIFGTVMAVEFPAAPEGGWKVQADPLSAPGIRAVAAMHKNAEGVLQVIETWSEGKTMFSDSEWTVSMENEANIEDGGFLLRSPREGASGGGTPGEDTRPTGMGSPEPGQAGRAALFDWEAATPEDFRALGWTYVPWAMASDELKGCLKPGGYIGLGSQYRGMETLFLNGGLNGKIFYYGVALTPAGKESRARVGRITASVETEDPQFAANRAAAGEIRDIIVHFCEKISRC